MSTQSKTMPMLDLRVYARVVAFVFCISSITAFVLAGMRLLSPGYFYTSTLIGSNLIVHYFISGLMLVTSAIGFLNSASLVYRHGGAGGGAGGGARTGSRITTWLLLDSLFETSRVVYVFVCEIVLKGKGTLQLYDLLISAAQYLVDSFLYCQMILRH